MSPDLHILRDALLRTHWVLNHPSVSGMATMAAVHGSVYTGPVWHSQPEIQEALKAAGLPAELPTPLYPKDEAGLFLKKYQDVEVQDVQSGSITTYTEHKWEEPSPEEAVFLGTFKECFEWLRKEGKEASRVPNSPCPEVDYYLTRTGRVVDKGEEKAFFAKFATEGEM